MTPKEFINIVFIEELGVLKDTNPYISFAIMAAGIEFLGKCLDRKAKDWNVSNKSKFNFEYAIKHLESLKPYRPYLTSHKLWDSLRNGFAHSFVAKYPITLSSKGSTPHLLLFENDTRLNLRCEDLYEDFKKACKEVINMNFPNPKDKMNHQFLAVAERTDNKEL